MDGAENRGSRPEPSWYLVEYEKSGPLRYLSHLDLLNIWERALRRSGLPLYWKGGFRPRPRLSAGPALPLGFESRVEKIALALAGPVGCGQLAARLESQLPPGLNLVRVQPGRDLAPSGQPAWRLTFTGDLPPAEQLRQRLQALGPAEDRRGRAIDPAAAVLELMVEGPELTLRLDQAAERGVRPDLLADLLGLDRPARIEKTAAPRQPGNTQEQSKEQHDTEIIDQRGRPGGATNCRRGKR